jgi:hypothetical protein
VKRVVEGFIKAVSSEAREEGEGEGVQRKGYR